MNKIYFIGGAKGVGKSSIIRHIIQYDFLPVINTGKFFSSLEPSELTQEKIVDNLIKSAPAIADTHYAGYFENKLDYFKRGLTEPQLERLSENVNLDLILVDLDPEKLLERRKLDLTKPRDYNSENIRRELESNKLYFQDYCMQLNKQGKVINNSDLNQTLFIMKKLFGM